MVRYLCGEPMMRPNRNRIAYMCVLSLEVLGVIGVTIASIAKLKYPLQEDSQENLAFALAVLANAVFVEYFIIHGILFERQGEIVIVMITSCLAFAYGVYSYLDDASDVSKDERIVRLIIVCVGLPLNLIWSWLIMRKLNWLTVEIAGADDELQTLYSRYCYFMTLMELDFQISICWVLLAFFSEILSTAQQALVGCGLAIAILLMVTATVMVKTEMSALVAPFVLLILCEPAFIIYKLWEVGTEWKTLASIVSYPIVVLGSAAFVVHIIAMVVAVLVIKGFGKGLKESLSQKHEDAPLLY